MKGNRKYFSIIIAMGAVISVFAATSVCAFETFDVNFVIGGSADSAPSGGIQIIEVPEVQIDSEGFVIGYTGDRDMFKHSDLSVTEPTDEPDEELEQTESPDLSTYPDEVLRLVNIEREKAGLNPLSSDPALSQMAQKRADELQERYSHTRPDNSRCSTVFDEYSNNLIYDGENIAAGATPQDVVDAWMHSKGHRENILRNDARYLGVGVATSNGHSWFYWTQVFAK